MQALRNRLQFLSQSLEEAQMNEQRSTNPTGRIFHASMAMKHKAEIKNIIDNCPEIQKPPTKLKPYRDATAQETS